MTAQITYPSPACSDAGGVETAWVQLAFVQLGEQACEIYGPFVERVFDAWITQ
jgi:hypothetical protein